MEEELNGPLCAGFESVIPSILEEGTCKDLCGDGSLLAGRGPMPCDEPESLAAYPITLPSMPLSFATVQWDVPTPADLPSPMTDSSSVDELSCSDGVSPDWVVNPLSMVPPTPTESVPADDMLPDGNEVTLPQSVAPPSEQHSDSNQQACDPVEEDVTMSPMATGDKELSLSGDEEISPSEEPSAEDTAPVETECTDTSELPECNSDHAKSPGEEESVPDMEEEEEEEKNQPLPETVTEIETEEEEQEQDCCADAGGDDGGTLEENMCCDSTQDGEGVVTESSVSCGDETTAGEPTALTQESRDGEEIPVSGEDEQRDPDEDPTSADQMTAPEPTEPQESESVDGMEDSPQPNNGSLTEQQEPPETGEENQPESSSSPGETAACEEGTEGSDGEERSEVAQLMHDGETSTLTEEQIAESSGSPTSETEGTKTCQSLEGEELEEMGLETAEHNIEQTESLNDQPEVENMEEASAQPEEMEQSLGVAESEPSETEHISENMEETMVDGGLSIEAERLEETGMEVSDMTKSIEESDDTQGGESRSETNQTAESAEMNSTEEQTTPTETKESNDTQLPTELEKTPTEESEEAAQTDSNPEQSETKQQEGQPIEQIEASPQTERTELTECAKSSAQTQNETEQTASAAEESEGSLQRHMEETTEQLEGQMQGTGDSEEVETAAVPYMNGGGVDRDEARRLAEKLFRLEGIHRTDVVRHLDKDNDFSRVVGEEYLKFFDFTGQTLDQGLRAFLKVVVLIGETQERERVLQRFSSRFHECNPHVMPSSGAVLTLTCAIMLLNTDLHGQNVGKAMSQSNFVSNLDGMNDGENFSKDLLKGLYNSIKNEPLEWAVDEKELQNSMLLPEDAATDASMRSKSNPFQSVPHDKKATVFHKGFLKRKAHADIDGKRTPWGKRSWKTFYAVLKGMVLYLQKDDYSSDWNSSEEVVSVHHALAERAVDYTKRPYVFRLQTADWRVFLFEAASTEQMNSWIVRINLVSALYSSPPFPAAVGSQRKFSRPILPASQSTLALDKQLQSHAAMLQSFQEDLAHLQEGLPEGRKPKARELEEYKVKEDYLQHERSRYEMYVQMLEAWGSLKRTSKSEVTASNLGLFDQEVCKDAHEEEDDEVDGAMKRSHSSPSLELETAPPPVVKVRRNISERRTYRKIIIPRRNREL